MKPEHRIITLKHPIVISENKTITEVKLKEFPTAEDYLAFDLPGRNAQLIALVASMTTQDESIIKKMHGDDYKELSLICDKMAYPEFYAEEKPEKAKAAAEKKEQES